jgi:electron transport complex protein RnfC
MSKHKTFRGGYKFPEFKGQPDDTLEISPIPQQVNIPLRQGFGLEVDCLVKVGDKVSAGQIIGSNDQSVSSPVHATINGVVEKISKSNYLGQDYQIVSIKGDGSSEYKKIPDANSNWDKLSPEEIEKLLYNSGVTALDFEGIPTRFNSSIIQTNDVENIIIHGVNSEPYSTSTKILLQDKNISSLVEGMKILHKIMPKSKIHLALSKHSGNAFDEIGKLIAGNDWLNLCYLEAKYPQDHDAMLVQTVLRQKFPYGYSAANIGVVILGLQTVLHVYEAVVEGKPLIERVIALCGSALSNPLHIKVRIGTAIGDIIGSRLKQNVEARYILNSLLIGTELNGLDIPIGKTFSQIIAIPENRNREFLAFINLGLKRDSYSRTFMSKLLPMVQKTCDTNMHGEGRPCISCNYCEEVCPVSIMPHILSKYIQRSLVDETLMNLRIFNCIQCGLCSFVCPSKIPLSQHIKEGEEMLKAQGCTRDQCILPNFSNLKGVVEDYRGAKDI